MRIAMLADDEAPEGVERVAYASRSGLDAADAVMFDPNSLPAVYAAFREADGVLSPTGSQQLLADLRHRRQDLTEYLHGGGVLVVAPPGPAGIRVHTLETIIEVPLGHCLPVELAAVESRPERVAFQGGEPFRSFWLAVADVLDPRWRLARRVGQPLIVDENGGVFGSYLSHGRGHLLIVPFPRPDGWRTFIGALAPLVDALTLDGADAPPRWASRYGAPVELSLHREADRLREQRAALDRQLEEIGRKLHPFERRKLLLSASGRPFVEAVADAFATLGCSVYQGPFSDSDLVIERPEGVALADAVAADGDVPDSRLTRLRSWLDAFERRNRIRPKGILVVNPFRRLDPAERPPTSGALAKAAASYGVAILPGLDLFWSLAAADREPGDADRIVSELLSTPGDPAGIITVTGGRDVPRWE